MHKGLFRQYHSIDDLDYTRHILSGWPMNEILSSQPQQVDRIVDQGESMLRREDRKDSCRKSLPSFDLVIYHSSFYLPVIASHDLNFPP
jgi:hypothetical protein